MTDEWSPIKARTAIAEMYVKLRGEAVNRAGDPDIPGGAAMVMLGPGADVEAWNYVQLSALMGRLHLGATEHQRQAEVAAIVADDIEPPLSFLASWADIVRDELNLPVAGRARIVNEIRFLRSALDWMLSTDEWGEPTWLPVEDFQRRLHQVRRKLEDVLLDGDRKRFSRVRCTTIECDRKPRLEIRYGSTAEHDRHVCPDCGTRYDREQYHKAKEQNLRDEGADRFVLVTQALDASEVPKVTVHSWVRRLKVRAACDLRTKRLMVWWPDIRQRAQERELELLRRNVS